jgi:hypothetical protein
MASLEPNSLRSYLSRQRTPQPHQEGRGHVSTTYVFMEEPPVRPVNGVVLIYLLDTRLPLETRMPDDSRLHLLHRKNPTNNVLVLSRALAGT